MHQEQLLEILCENYDLENVSLQFLRDGGGTVYIVEAANEKYLLKVVGDTFSRTIRQSVAIMRYLEEHDFPFRR